MTYKIGDTDVLLVVDVQSDFCSGGKRVFLAGLALDFCVRYSAEDAHRCGFDVMVVEDACRGIDVGRSMDATRQAFAQLAIPRAAVEVIG